MQKSDAAKNSMHDSSAEEAIFEAAISLSNLAMRGEYLDTACQGNQALRHRIESLLKAAEDVDSFMRTPAVCEIVAEAVILLSAGITKQSICLDELDRSGI